MICNIKANHTMYIFYNSTNKTIFPVILRLGEAKQTFTGFSVPYIWTNDLVMALVPYFPVTRNWERLVIYSRHHVKTASTTSQKWTNYIMNSFVSFLLSPRLSKTLFWHSPKKKGIQEITSNFLTCHYYLQPNSAINVTPQHNMNTSNFN